MWSRESESEENEEVCKSWLSSCNIGIYNESIIYKGSLEENWLIYQIVFLLRLNESICFQKVHILSKSEQLEPGCPLVAYWRGGADLRFAIISLW